MVSYSVKELSEIAGVSVRTLHLYDEIGLLKPSTRTEARYRLYGENELLRLQQILFYKELGISLEEIRSILDDPEFDLLQALESHKVALSQRKERVNTMLTTIDKTISQLKEKKMLKHEELYEGLPKEEAEALRKEAIEEYGMEQITRSENHLRKMSKTQLNKLKEEQKEIANALLSLMNSDYTRAEVQHQIALHYANIRNFWGTAGSSDKQANAYKCLGELYINDARFTTQNGHANPAFALFLSKAMTHFAENNLE
ncbi:MAG: MerR family transcriptional regulator [Azospira oryzae]|jgi:DNA-binding transcriptional MerR regulator|nr:MAG: MerR family transcriptional regulator [Azospira oryzae]